MTRLLQIGPSLASHAMRFCEEYPDHCTYIAGWIHDGGLEDHTVAPRGWLLADLSQSKEVLGLVYMSATGIVIPVLQSDAAIEQVVSIARMNPGIVRVLVGQRSHVESFWERLAPIGMQARLRRDQFVYFVTRETYQPIDSDLELKVARERDLDEVVEASAAMAREEAHDDPQGRNPEMFRERIRARLARQRDFIHRDNGELVFKANVSALSPLSGQVEGIYTIPEARQKGFGFRGTAAVTSWILGQAPRTILLVNDDNTIARKMYESLGYQSSHESQTIFIAP